MGNTHAETGGTAQTTTADAPQDRLLLVEDDAATVNLMTRLLQTVGIAVESVGTVKDGLAALSRMPAVVILDLMPPDGSGVEVLEAIRAAKMRCKVAVVSASTDTATFRRLRAASPDAIFSKPLDFEDFVQWLCEAFPESAGQEVAA
jgi:DNA-binding response OmpR family regulator